MTMSLVSAAEGKYDHINFVPPESVANAAKRGLEYRQKASPSNRGGLTPSEASKEGIGSGVQRASDLKNRKTLSPETINKMVAFFARHEKNKSVKDGKKPWEDKGHVAWLLWGGDPGKTWAEKVKKQMETADQKKQANHTPEHAVAQQLLSHLLAALRAAQQSHWTMHWQVQGTSFYGDHQMFERLYEGLGDEIDTLAEKMVAGFGEESVNLPEQMKWQAFLAYEWNKDDDLYYRALHIEQYLQKHFKQTYDALKRLDQMSLGLDDFLMSTANSHETNLYLLGQRIGRKLAAKGRLKYRVYLFSDDPTSGKPLWTKEFYAEDDARADQEALRLVKPELNKHDNAEDWVVEPVGHKGKKAFFSEDARKKFYSKPLNYQIDDVFTGIRKWNYFNIPGAQEGEHYTFMVRNSVWSLWDKSNGKSKKVWEVNGGWDVAVVRLKELLKNLGRKYRASARKKPAPTAPKPVKPIDTLTEIKTFIAKQRTWLELDEHGKDYLYFTTRDNGDIVEEKPGSEDIREAQRIGRLVLKEFAGLVAVDLDVVDEWTELTITLKGGRRSAKSNQKIIETPHNFHPVKVEPPKAKRSEFPFEGFIDFQGILIDVENTKGSTRKGTGPEGEWSTYMHSHYGEIRGTEGVDGDKLDVYVGDNHDSPVVVVIHQHNPWDGKYDEDKVMIGFDSVEEAIGAYKKQYDRPGFYIMDDHTAMNIGSFWRWVKDTRNKGKRVTASKKASPADDMVYRAEPRKGWLSIDSGGDIAKLAQTLNLEMIRRVPPPQRVGKIPGAKKAFSFHWSNAQGKWDVIAVRDFPWDIDGAEFFVFVGAKATSPTGKLWTLTEMQYVAQKLNKHPGYASSPESTRRVAGWWAINHEGGSVPPPVDKGVLLNAIPGVDDADQSLYNGDGPADIMDVAIRDIIGTYERAWGRKPFIEEVQAVFKFCANPKVLESSDGLKWAERAAKVAAQVGTDTATVYAIAPEQLASIIEAGAWGLEWKNGTAGANNIIRQHGGAVFHTGGDEMFDVTMPDALKEFDLTEPYGTEAFDPKAIAAKYLAKQAALKKINKQAGNNAAVQGIFDGIPSDGGAWHGGPPKFFFDFTGPKAKIVAHSERNSVHEWKVKFIFEPSQTGSGSGGYVESFLIKRHLNAFPQDKNAVLDEAARRFSKEAGKLSQHVQKHVLTQTWKYVSATVGYQNAEEYENESASNVNVRWSNKPVLSRHQNAIWFPAEVTATIKATKLPSLSKGVFTEMDDRELDYWISRWEGMAPENFWMDGELNMSRSQAMQYYRKQWRNWTPRQQESMWNNLKSNRYASQKWTRENTLLKLMDAGAYNRGSTWPDSKDVGRISDIAYKGRDADGMTRLAIKQAKLIKDIAKAIRRGYAAETHRGKNPTITEVVSQIFYTRALELAGLGRMEVPTVAPKAKPKFNPPAIPTNLVPTDARGWQLYSMGGAETAAKGLTSVMQNALMSVGRNVTPYNTDSANAKNLSAIIDRMHKALNTRSQYGASDSEPRNVMYDVFEGYLKLYLDRWEWPKTWQVING